MHQATRPASRQPGKPARLVLIAFLLALLAGWQGWHCANDGMATPSAGAHSTHDSSDQPNSALMALCVGALAAVAGALFILAAPRRAVALFALLVPAFPVLCAREKLPVPSLTQLCVSRT